MIARISCIGALCLALATSAGGEDLGAAKREAFQAAAAKVAPSVVQIETVGGMDQAGELPLGAGPTTGLIVDPAGYIVSSSVNFAHRPSGIVVRLEDGGRLGAELVATDHNRKIALLKVETDSALPVPDFAESENVRVGQWSIAVGRAFDPQLTNVAVGIISAVGRIWGKALQTDAAVSPNNYGGPLVNLEGEVIGLLVPMSPQSDEEIAGLEWYDSGIGFAVPTAPLREAVSRLKAGEDLHAGRIGLTLKKSVAMSGPPVVATVLPNSPADKAGLKKGDRIVRVSGKNVSRAAEIKYALAARYAGDTLDLLVRRGDETIEARAELAAELEPYRCPVLGILPKLAKTAEPGVAVRFVVPESAAAEAGISSGDRIVAIDDEPLAGSDELRARIARFKPEETITLVIVSDEKKNDRDVVLGGAPDSLAETLPSRPVDPEAAAGREVPLTLPEWENEISAYLPKGYSDQERHKLLLWLPSPSDADAGLDRWKKHADSGGLIVVVVKPSSSERWWPKEVELVRDVLRLCRRRFALEADEIVVGGHAGGGTLAYRTATLERENLRGCAAFDARPAGPPLTDHPDNRFGLLIGRSEQGTLAERLDQVADLLRKGGLPVVVVPRESPAGRLTEADLAAVVRWIALLDLI